MTPHCFLAPFSPKPCDGRLVKAHILPRALLKRERPRDWRELVDDPRTWACLPVGVEEIAAELGLGWWLTRRFGEGQVAA